MERYIRQPGSSNKLEEVVVKQKRQVRSISRNSEHFLPDVTINSQNVYLAESKPITINNEPMRYRKFNLSQNVLGQKKLIILIELYCKYCKYARPTWKVYR